MQISRREIKAASTRVAHRYCLSPFT